MISNKIGCVTTIFCLFLLIQSNNSPTVSLSYSNAQYLHTSDSFQLLPIENTVPESTFSTIENPNIAPQSSGTVAIVVQNSLYPSISDAVTQYRLDLNNTGYHTLLYTDVLSNAEELKSNFSLWYDSEGLIGAVLIGRLPYAQYYHPATESFAAETFICDLFLTDLDGNWGDSLPDDGIYDRAPTANPGRSHGCCQRNYRWNRLRHAFR